MKLDESFRINSNKILLKKLIKTLYDFKYSKKTLSFSLFYLW